MPFIANTEAERQEMLQLLGCESVEELWSKAQIPVASNDFSHIAAGLTELEAGKKLQGMAAKNSTDLTYFVGMGYYDHFIPAAVSEIIGQAGFYTAYTPYQPEASQGTLQAIFEWQSAIARLTGMEVANASLYDGGSAVFEAMAMALRSSRKRKQVIVSEAMSPIYRKMLNTYSANLDCEIKTISADKETSSIKELSEALSEDTACVIVQYPNVFGTIEDWTEFVAEAKAKSVICIAACYPTALSLLKTPGEFGFDIVVGEGQPLGLNLSFGGPYLGYMCTTNKLVRRMPGRIAGKTVDNQGRTGYVLTLQAREQHIRREQAVSNICSNKNLCAVAALVYMSVLGKEGLKEVADLSMKKARYAANKLTEIPGVKLLGNSPFFNEFVIELPCPAEDLVSKVLKQGYAAGIPLGQYYPERENQLLIAVTEKRSKEEIDQLAKLLEAAI